MNPDKAAYVRSMFNRIAPRYDAMNALMTFGQHHAWRRAAARLAQPPRDGLALDLGVGTGDFAAALRELEPTCRVIGIDFAAEMMQRGRTKLNGRGNFVQGDILRLPLNDDQFDCAVNGFVLRNVADLRALFAEMYRVLKPNGRAVCLDAVSPRAPVWRDLFALYFERALPRVTGWLSGQNDAYRYLPRSVRDFIAPEHATELLRGAGLRDVRCEHWAMGSVAVWVGVK